MVRPTKPTRKPTPFGLRLVLTFGVASWIFSGCVDLTEPWKKGDAGGARGLRLDAAVAIDGSSQIGGSGGVSGSGGDGGSTGLDGDGVTDVSGSDGIDDTALGGAGGGLDGGGGTVGVDSAQGGSDGNIDSPIGGTGGVTTGGTAGTRDAGTGGAGGLATGGTAGSATGGSAGRADASQGGAGGTVTADAPVVETGRDGPTANADTILSNGLVVYYPCEQATGTTLPDLSGNNNHGTLTAAPGLDGGSPVSGYSFETGKVGNALTLSQAGGGYVSMPAGVFKGATEVTIATWIKLKTLSTFQRVFDVGINANLAQNASTGPVYMTLYLKDLDSKNGFTSTKNGYSNAQQITTAGFSSSDGWKHLAVVLSSGGGILYVDGASVGASSSILPPKELGAIDYAFIGKSQFSSDVLLDAQIDEFRVYNRALSASEIQALFKYTGP